MKRLIVSFFSLACVGALNATDCIWTGGADPADGKWSTPENWQDGLVPGAVGDTVKLSGVGLVDGEITNDIKDLTIAGLDFSGATPFRLVGEKLSINGWNGALKKTATVTVTNACDIACVNSYPQFVAGGGAGGSFVLTGAFSGDVAITYQGYSWVVAGDNRQLLRGSVISANANVTLAHTNAIGAAGTTFTAMNGSLGLAAPGEYHNNFNLNLGTLAIKKVGVYTLCGAVTNATTGTFGPNTYHNVGKTGDNNTKVIFDGEVYMPNASFYPMMYYNQEIRFKQKATFAKTTGSNYFSDGAVPCYFDAVNDIPLLRPNRQHRILCGIANAFPGSTLRCDVEGTQHVAGSPEHKEAGVFSLNGFDQTLVRVDNGNTTYSYYGEGKEHGTISTPTGKPATLRLEPTEAQSRTVSYLMGPLSLTLAAADATYVQAFSNRTHSTTGTLTAERGVLRFDGKTTLASVPTIAVGAEGAFELETSLAAALKGLKTLTVADGGKFTLSGTGATSFTDNQTDVTLAGSTSELTLPAGDYKFRSLTVNGEALAAGTHTGDAIPAQVKGATSITVVTTVGTVWTGAAGDGKWSTAANWQDGLVPRANYKVNLSGVGLVDGEITNDIANLTIAGLDFSGATPFRLVGEKLSINGWDNALKKTATVAVTNACDIACVNESTDFTISAASGGRFVLNGAFSGDVALKLSGGAWWLAGNNTQTRGVTVQSGSIRLSNTNAIGAAGASYVNLTGQATYFTAAGGYHANFTINGHLCFETSGDYHFYGAVTNTSKGSIWIAGDGTGNYYKKFSGNTYFHEEFYAPQMSLYTLQNSNNEIHFLKKLTLRTTNTGYWDNYACKLFVHEVSAVTQMSPGTQLRVYCAGTNVLPGTLLRFDISGSGGRSLDNYGVGVFNLQGYDQTLLRVDNGTSATSYFGEGKEHGLITTPTDKPATLRLEPTEAKSRTVAYLQGPLSLTLAATDATYVQAFSNRTHSTTGNIAVERGVLRFDGKTTLQYVPSITVAEEGTFELVTSKTGALAGLTYLSVADGGVFTAEASAPFTAGLVDVVLGETTEMTLSAGAYSFNSLIVDGETFVPKTYTGDEIPSQLKGVTSLTVTSYPRATWTGLGGDGKWSTAANWRDGEKPQTGWGVILSNPSDDFEIVNDLGAMTLSSFVFQGANPFRFTGAAITMDRTGATVLDSASAAITNAVVFNFPAGDSTVTVSGGKAYYITGGLCGADANITLTQKNSSSFLLGGVGTVKAVSMNANVNLLSDTFLGEGATLTTSVGDITFYAGGDYRFNYKYTGTDSSDLRVKVSDTNYNWYGSFDRPNMAAGNYLYLFNCRSPHGDQVSWNAPLRFYGPVNLGAGSVHGLYAGGVSFYAPLTCTSVYGRDNGWDATGPIYLHATNDVDWISPGYSLNIVLRAPDVVPNAVLNICMPTRDGTWVDIDGYDQTFDRIVSDARRIAGSDTLYLYSGGSGRGHLGKATSLPATLTLKATASSMTALNVANAITLVLDATDKSFTQAFTNKVCDTTGDLIVKKGVFKIARGNSFANVKNVTVGKEGKLVIDTNIASALKSVTNITVLAGGALEVAEGVSMPITSGTPSLTLETGASVTIPSSATYTFNWAEKDGVSLEKNVAYTSANLPELTSGTIVTTRRKPHSTGLMLLIK